MTTKNKEIKILELDSIPLNIKVCKPKEITELENTELKYFESSFYQSSHITSFKPLKLISQIIKYEDIR
jgi:hypothetical protein